jgi:hypothetical protein
LYGTEPVFLSLEHTLVISVKYFLLEINGTVAGDGYLAPKYLLCCSEHYLANFRVTNELLASPLVFLHGCPLAV